jgi:hypothetical protein
VIVEYRVVMVDGGVRPPHSKASVLVIVVFDPFGSASFASGGL